MSVTMDDRRDVAAIHPLEFWTDYQPAPDGTMTPFEWVRWVKKGDAHGATTEEKIVRAQRTADIWNALRPHYEAWKRGQDVVVDGTPLDAVPFVTKEVVKVFARVHIRSVEDLANAEDAALAKLNIPGVRAMQHKARAFLDAQSNLSGVSAELAELRAALAELRAENNELAQARDMLAAETGRRRRSREEVMQPVAEG
jgi:hypothetical protein